MIGLLLVAVSGYATAQPADLSGWQSDGSGVWQLDSADTVARQTLNVGPSVLHNNRPSQGQWFRATIEVETVDDNDFVGLVFGYQDGDISAATPDYYLIDWKQETQTAANNVVGEIGLALSRVTGPIFAEGVNDLGGPDAYGHIGVVEELARGINLGSTGWQESNEYRLDLFYGPDRVQLYVDGILELDESGTFPDGAIGFYNFSQPQTRYAAIEGLPDAAPVPVAPAFPLLLIALAAMLWLAWARLR
ncbi:MAG TPA: hypothetical protein VJ902_06530 [Wenzhouxiangellaceae bacterium]|nr:hypothetical protein [Wenzhouxiangellaceae bacterium]